MKVLLISPPYFKLFGESMNSVPISLAYVAGALKKAGHDVATFNADFNPDCSFRSESVKQIVDKYSEYKSALNNPEHPVWAESKKIIRNFRPDIVGISIMTCKYKSSINIARLAKEEGLPVIVGGPHPTLLPEETIKEKEFDVVVKGEGEITMPELISAMDEGKSLDDIKGITYKKDGKTCRNPDREFIKNLDEIPFPAREADLMKEKYAPEAFGQIFASRGCPYNCLFCSNRDIWGRNVRFRSPENIIEEIRMIKREFGTKYFNFQDDMFAINKDWTMKLCGLIKSERIVWSASTRVDAVTDSLAKNMSDAGCKRVFLGIESGSQKMLEIMRKGITLEQTRVAISIFKKHKISTIGYFVFGIPGETKNDIQKTLKFTEELKMDRIVCNITTPQPCSDLWRLVNADSLNLDYSDIFPTNPNSYFNPNMKKEDFRKEMQDVEKFFDNYNKRRKKADLLKPAFFMDRLLRLKPYKPGQMLKIIKYLAGPLK